MEIQFLNPSGENILGTYKVEFGGGWEYKSSENIPTVEVKKKDNYLYLDDYILVEYKQGLFFTKDGEALDFRKKEKTLENIVITPVAITVDEKQM